MSIKREGLLPPIDGGSSAILSRRPDEKIIICVEQSMFELDYLAAITLANQIMTTVEVYLREKNA